MGSTGDTPAESAASTASDSTTDDPNVDTSGGGSESSAGSLGLVPMQLLSIHGGRFARSCDGGTTWSEMWEHNANADCFHDPDSLYARPAYGNGVFVVPSGWGDPGAMYVSTDGLDWQRFPTVELPGGAQSEVDGAGVFFDGASFGVFRRLRSPNGFDWNQQKDDLRPPGVGNVRRVAFSEQDGMLIVLGNDGNVAVSVDWAQTWSNPPSAVGACQSSQHRGDIVIRDGQVVIAGNLVCVSDDAGTTWTTTWTPPSSVVDVLTTPNGYVALHADESVSSSADGLSWSPLGQLPTNANMTAGTWSGQGDGLVVYAARDNEPGQVFTSADGGENWTLVATLPGTDCPRINLETFLVPEEICQ